MLNFSSSSVISSLIENSHDGMNNLFYIEFIDDYTSDDSDLSNSIKIRTNNFTPPNFTQGNYTVNYMTVDMQYPSATFSGSKTLSFTMRIDREYEIYKYLLGQQAKTSAANLGFATNEIPDPSAGGLTIKVYTLTQPLTDGNQVNPDNLDEFTLIYTFKYCWIQSVQLSGYSYSGSNPVTATVTIGFMDFEDPQNLLG